MKLKSTLILSTIAAKLFLFSCNDTKPKTYTYVIKGNVSIDNNCYIGTTDMLGQPYDTVSKDFELGFNLYKGRNELSKQSKIIR
jgi:hypothetical protein